MRILLTAGTGFLGSHLVKKMIFEGFEVTMLKRSFSNCSRIAEVIDRSNLHVYDIDKIDLKEVFKQNRYDIVVHTATMYGKNNESVHTVLESNLIYPIKIIELAIEHKVKAFINTDSYFNKENTSYNRLLNYSLSKKSLLTWLRQFSKEINIINVILEHIYGPYDSSQKFVENIIQKIAVEKVDRVSLTHGHQKRDFVYVDDVAEAYVILMAHACTHSFTYKTVEVGSGRSIEIKEFVRQIKQLSKSRTVLGFGEVPYRADEIMDSKADISQLLELGWSPKTNVRDGLSKILELYRK